MDPTSVDAALAAYWRFFDGFNSRDATNWAAGLNFPHVRISGRTGVRLTATREQHHLETDFSRVQATGWDRSVGAQPEVLHASADVVHIAGGWTRFDSGGRPILLNRVGYVITRALVDGQPQWGIQARFGIDPGPAPASADSTSSAAPAGHGVLIEQFLQAMKMGDLAAIEACARFPFVLPAPGQVTLCEAGSKLLACGQADSIRAQRSAPMLRCVQAGPTATNWSIEWSQSGQAAYCMLIERDGRWGVQALSWCGH